MSDELTFPAREPAWTGGFDQLLRWGINPVSGEAFWLRQQTAGRGLASSQTMTATLATFQRQHMSAELLQDSEPLTPALRKAWRARGDWSDLQYNWRSGSFLGTDAGAVRGRLFTPTGTAHCLLQPGVLQPVSRLTWPLGGVTVQEASWQGDLTAASLKVSGHFCGAQWQHWGRFVSPGMAMAHGLHFDGRPDVSFFGLGQRLVPQWQHGEALSLGMAQLSIGKQTFRFDRWWPAATVDAPRVDNYRWMATLVNSEHRLQISIDGGNPRLVPWLALNDILPGGGQRLLRITPFASFRLRLFRRGSQQPLHDVRADSGLLMTAAADSQVLLSGPLSLP